MHNLVLCYCFSLKLVLKLNSSKYFKKRAQIPDSFVVGMADRGNDGTEWRNTGNILKYGIYGIY